MRRFAAGMLTLGLLVAVATPAQAQMIGDFLRRCHTDFKRNNSWPNPFLKPDQEAVTMPFELMTRNGWRKQTMICDYHFENDETKLTAAGELKVRWILTQAPPTRRAIFVQRGVTPEETAARIDAVHMLAARTIRTGQLPEVVETDLESYGWPAETVDVINKKRAETQPDPTLPARSEAGGSGM